jgi:hypothetical protein
MKRARNVALGEGRLGEGAYAANSNSEVWIFHK